MKDPNKDWMLALYLYWLIQFLAILIAASVVILVVHVVFGSQRMIEIMDALDQLFNNV